MLSSNRKWRSGRRSFRTLASVPSETAEWPCLVAAVFVMPAGRRATWTMLLIGRPPGLVWCTPTCRNCYPRSVSNLVGMGGDDGQGQGTEGTSVARRAHRRARRVRHDLAAHRRPDGLRRSLHEGLRHNRILPG